MAYIHKAKENKIQKIQQEGDQYDTLCYSYIVYSLYQPRVT